MPENTINMRRLQDLMDTYGANMGRWPHEERRLARLWFEQHPDEAQTLFTKAKELDQLLDTARPPETDISFLQARILKAASNTPQDIMTLSGVRAANDDVSRIGKTGTEKTGALATWKSVAATLIMTTGIGIGIGQVAAADTTYESAEALLSISIQNDYDEFDLNGEGL